MTTRLLSLALFVVLLPAPVLSQATDDTKQGLGLVQRGIGMLFRQFQDSAGPDVEGLTRDLSDRLQQMAPALENLATIVDDIRNYEAPERLENGDILIRRRDEAPPPPPLGDEPAAPDDQKPAIPEGPQIAL
ncbi:AAA+ family ATPase [Paracoccus sp. (in: a-proteobacteria)]|uniref:AAA+ family ATPase n=1 Tax=Paracoccus sp. TaxID=267 RepID=UPI00396C492C